MANAEYKERTIQRRLFTTAVNKLDVVIKEGQMTECRIKTDMKKIADLSENLSRLDLSIKTTLLQEDCTEEDLESELTSALEYKNRFLEIETKVEIILRSSKEREKEKDTKRNFKLPEIKQKQFDGNIKNWLSYWGQFKKIDKDPKIDDDDKFLLLLQSMEEGSEVYSLVNSFPPSGSSYKACVEELHNRYAREEVLIEVYVREILKLVLQERIELTDLYDKLNANLRSLNTLGVSKCAAFVLPLVESALPAEILRLWERSKPKDNKGPEIMLPKLMEFLKSEVEGIQRIKIAEKTFTKTETEPSASCLLSQTKTKEDNSEIKTIKTRLCIWCNKDTHTSVECYKLSRMTIEERRAHLKKMNACSICLKKGHFYKTCKAFIKCHICGKRHSVAMCPGKLENKDQEKKKEKESPRDKSPITTTNLSSQGSKTLLQTVAVRIRNGERSILVRAVYDNGSQRSYIKEETARKLGLNSIRSESLKQCLFGGVVTENKKHNVYNLKLESIDDSFNIDIEALGQNLICGHVDKLSMTKETRQLIKKHNIVLTDIENSYDEIELLIGADYCGLLMTSGIIHLQNGLVAMCTRLGWTIQGKLLGSTSDNITTMFCVSQVDFTDLWSLESLGIRDSAQLKTKTDTEAEFLASFNQTVQKQDDGRYEVQLPFKVGHEELLSNYDKAIQRLESTTRSLKATGKLNEYDTVFKEWLAMRIIEEVPSWDKERNDGHFLPHKPIIKESSLTTKLRPVFDASAKDKNNLCLNTCLEKGMNMIDNIPNLLTNFRTKAIGITADIQKAFLQISLPPEDRNYLKFLWWEDETLSKIKIYRHCRLVFGLTCSPFLLAATLKHHLNQVTGKTAQLLQKSFYVDNLICSLNTEAETYNFIEEAKETMQDAQFNLRMWVTAPLQINETGKQIISVLGLNWDTATDQLFCNIANLPPLSAVNKVTKRILLSLTQKIFDPIGITCPVTLPMKLLMQEAWRRELKWDEPLPDDLTTEFKKWYVQINYLELCRVPRRLTTNNISECKLSLHMFSDASKLAMGACIFLRSEKGNNTTVQLLAAKSRVAPPKQISIPRLELLAALMGSRLLSQVRETDQLKNCPSRCWTDSSVVLCWVKSILPLETFVGNRVKEIKEHTKPENWCHISGSLNWADLASRGCNAKQLSEYRWTEGPPFLLKDPKDWPISPITVDEDEVKKELKTPCNVNICTNKRFSDRLLYFSKYSKIVRTVAWILKFKDYNLKKEKIYINKEITGYDYEKAENIILRIIQQEDKESLENRSKNFNTYIDENNLIRIKTKLLLSNLPEGIKCPIIVMANNEIIRRLVRQRHEHLQHAGTNMLITDLRNKYWIFGVRRLVKSVIYNCLTCKKHKAKPLQAPAAPLPKERIEGATPFEITGIDLAGPLILKNHKKTWIVLYTCAVYRAIHLELTPSLSTEAFIRTLRRFIARRGRVKVIFSDNGSNFTGTNNLFKTIDWNSVQRETSIEKITWKFNAPTAAWWGGFWERLIRSIKELLRRILGKACVTYDELQTLLCDCECIMNNRPLTYVQDDDAESLEPLTPSCFLQPLQSCETADLDQIDHNSLNIRVKYLQTLRDTYRQRFKAEYLTELVGRTKVKGKTTEIKKGQVVLIESEGKRIKWPLGIVTKIFIGKDGISRTAEVKTSSGFKVRPVQRLYSLEVFSQTDIGECQSYSHPQTPQREESATAQQDQEEESPSSKPQEKVTKCGRKVKIPSKYTL